MNRRTGDKGRCDATPTRRVIATLAVTAMSAALAGCGVSSDSESSAACEVSKEKEIGFDYPLTTVPVYADLKRFAEEQAKVRGYELKYTADNGDVQTQNQNVQNWVTQGIPAIVTLPLEPSTMEPVAKDAKSKCIPVVTYASGLKSESASIRLSTKESGVALGKAALDWAGKQNKPIKVLVLNNRTLQAGMERDDGLKSVFPGTAKNIEIVSTQQAVDEATGEDVTRTQLQAHPDINMVLCYADSVALGATQAFVNAGVDEKDPGIFIGGQDGSKAGLEAVDDGSIFRVTVAIRIAMIGKAVVDIAADLLEGKDTDGIDVPAVPLTADSPELADYLSDYS